MFVLRRAPSSFAPFVISLFLLLFCTQAAYSSTITGIVYDPQRNPIPRLDVELMNENRTVIARTKTNGIGRYEFQVVIDALYYVRVLPFRTNLLDQTQDVRVETLSQRGQGTGYFTKDFILKRKQGGLADTETGVVFAQEVPKDAEILYEDAIDDLNKEKNSQALKKLIKAINVFPTYYAATQRLGIELLKSKQYLEATKLFMRAAEVNPKSSRAFYYMGFSLNKMGKKYNPAALKALKNATRLAPAAWEVAFLVGKIHREQGSFTDAEKNLVKSKKLAGRKVPSIHIELAQLYGNDLKQYGKAADELEMYLKSTNRKDNKIKKQIEDLRSKAKRT